MTRSRTLTSLFCDAGALMFGRDWQLPLSRAMSVNIRTMQRIAETNRKGEEYPLKPSMVEALAPLLSQHVRDTHDIAFALCLRLAMSVTEKEPT